MSIRNNRYIRYGFNTTRIGGKEGIQRFENIEIRPPRRRSPFLRSESAFLLQRCCCHAKNIPQLGCRARSQRPGSRDDR